MTPTTCAPLWRAPNAGLDHFALVNHSAYTATVLLFHPNNGKIVVTVRGIKAHKTRELVVRLKRGRHYMWGCDLKGRPPRTSEAETVPVDPNHGGPGPLVAPVSRGQLVPAMKSYRGYVSHELRLLKTQTTRLSTDLAGDDVTAAKAAWLTAHLTWLRIGQDDGAYGAFGNLGSVIDGTAAGLVKGTADPSFTGFHKVEFDLWTTGNVATATTDTTRLVAALTRLSHIGVKNWFPLTTPSVSDLPLRCHEILEDGLRDPLSGDDDYGSGTSLASVRADVTGTRELLGLLAALIKPRSPHLTPRAHRRLTHLAAALEATRSSNGDWVAVAHLARAKRERVDAAIGHVLETLAPVPDLLTIGNS